MSIFQMDGYFENPYYCFLEELMLYLLILKWNLKKKMRFPVLRQKPT